MKDTIYRQAAIDVVHKSILDFFDICDDDEESPMTYKDKQLLEINKAITTQIKSLPSAQPEIVRCKDCKHGSPNGRYGCRVYHYRRYETHDMKPDDFCSRAERREE